MNQKEQRRELLLQGKFRELFNDLGWDRFAEVHSVVLKDGISRVVNGLQLPLPEPGSFSL